MRACAFRIGSALLIAAACTAPERGATPEPGREATPEERVAATGARIEGRVLADGRPVRARVELRRVEDEPGEREWSDTRRELVAGLWVAAPVAVADADGTYGFDGLTPGVYAVAAQAPDGRSGVGEADVSARGQRVVLDLELFAPAGDRTLRGRVVGFDPRGARASVAAGLPGRRPGNGGELGRDGSFVLTGLAPGSVAATLLVAGRVFVGAPSVEVGDAPVEIDVGPLLRALDVRVIDAGDQVPVVGASVWCSGDDVDGCATTGRDGAATVDAPSKPCVVRVRADAFLPAQIDVPEGSRSAVVRMVRGADVSVRVTAAGTGRAIVGAPVWWTTFGSFDRGGPAVTDEKGVAHLGPLRAGPALVFVAGEHWVSDGLAPVWGGSGRFLSDEEMSDLGSSAARRPREGVFEFPASGPVLIELRAEPALAVAGRVLDPSGAPVGGAVVSAGCPEWFPWPQVWRDAPWPRVATGPDGTFVLAGVFPQAKQEVRVAAAGFVGTKAPLPAAGAFAELRLVESATPTVVVRERGTGKPIPGAEVTPRHEGGSGPLRRVHRDTWRWTTRQDGTVRVGPLAVSTWSLLVEADGYLESSSVTVAPERLRSVEPVVVEIDRGLDVTGRVLLPDGTPARKGVVYVSAVDATTRGGDRIGPGGTFARRGLAPGTYEILAEIEEGDRRFRGVRVVEAGGGAVELRLAAVDEKPREVVVRVVDPAGEPVASAKHWLRSSWHGTGGGFCGGRIELGQFGQEKQVTLEIYDVRDAAGQPYGVGPATIQLPHPVPADFVVRLEPDRPVTGVVRDADGRPLAGARVAAFTEDADERLGDSEAHGWAVTNADGSFDLRGLGAQRYRLETSVPPQFLPPERVIVSGGDKGVTIVAAPGVRPRVLVLGPDGEPLHGARVAVESMAPPTVATAATGADGWAVLPAMRPSSELWLEVDAEGDLLAHSASWTPAPETTVRLRRSLSISGTIVAPDGRPLAGARYWVIRGERSGFMNSRDESDADGGFEVREVAEDEEVLVAAGDFPWRQMNIPGWPSLEDEDAVRRVATKVRPGTTGARVGTPDGTTLAVRLAGHDGSRTREDALFLISADRGQSHEGVRLPDSGVHLFTGLTPRSAYALVARLPGSGRVAFRDGLVPGPDAVEVPLSPGEDLVGKVALPGEAPVHDIEVRVEFGALFVSTKAARDGAFRIPCLPPVRVEVRVFASEQDGDWCGDFLATPGGAPLTLRPEEKPIPATPR